MKKVARNVLLAVVQNVGNKKNMNNTTINTAELSEQELISLESKMDDAREIEQERNSPGYEPEDCDCKDEMEEDGIEYTQDFTAQDGTWICDHCGRPQ